MNIKVGDTVRFLNDIGGGKVVGFNGSQEVVVEQEDGFGFPVAVDQCVVVSSAVQSSAMPSAPAPAKSETKVISSVQSYGAAGRNPDELKVFLAFVPEDVDNLETSDFELYLINNSDYGLFFSLLEAQENGYKSRKNTLVSPGENLLVEHVRRANVGSLEKLCVQIAAFKSSGKFVAHKPIDRIVNTRLVKFFKRNSFVDSPFLGCPAMSIDLTKDSIQEDIAKLKESLATKDQPTATAPAPKKKVVSNSEMLEIDLHIDSLLDSTKGMSSGEMLEYQITYFKKIMADNERFTGKKIIFIHGKGDGVLRRALETELKKMGRGNKYQQASFKKYGYGAILVIV